MPFKYRRIPLDSVKNLQKAERLHALGWKIIRSTLFSITFEKYFPRKRG